MLIYLPLASELRRFPRSMVGRRLIAVRHIIERTCRTAHDAPARPSRVLTSSSRVSSNVARRADLCHCTHRWIFGFPAARSDFESSPRRVARCLGRRGVTASSAGDAVGGADQSGFVRARKTAGRRSVVRHPGRTTLTAGMHPPRSEHEHIRPQLGASSSRLQSAQRN